jgi:hypothetical protein
MAADDTVTELGAAPWRRAEGEEFHGRAHAPPALKARDALRSVVTEQAWRRYLKLEEAVNDRDHEYVTAAIRVAFKVSAERLVLAVWQAIVRLER